MIAGKELLAVCISFFTIVLLVALSRLFIAVRLGSGIKTVDILLVLAALSLGANQGPQIAALLLVIKAEGIDVDTLPVPRNLIAQTVQIFALEEHEVVRMFRLLSVLPIMMIIHIWLVKAGLCFIYFEHSRYLCRRMRICVWIVAVIVLLTFIGALLSTFLPCIPYSRTWRYPLDPEFCPAINKSNLTGQGVFSIVSDLAVLLYALALLAQLNLDRRLKGAVSVVVLVGTVSIMATIARWIRVWGYLAVYDSSKTDAAVKEAVLWSNLETFFAYLAVSLPAFRLFITRRKSNDLKSVTRTPQSNSMRISASRSKNRVMVWNRDLMASYVSRGSKDGERGDAQEEISHKS